MTIETVTYEMVDVFLLSVGAFLLAMFLTPIYTFFAYRYKFWKKQRSHSTDGKALEVFTKLHAAKFRRNIPTMAGIIAVVSIAITTLLFNLDRAQTWLPLAALVSGGIVGLIDDIINIKGLGGGAAGLRSGLKFALITVIGVGLGWFFFAKLGVDSFHVPFIGEVAIGWLIVPLFAFVTFGLIYIRRASLWVMLVALRSVSRWA
ncbi:hypothetical protein B7Z17_05120 [Candidatus Saccharibacteria bacterium 32-49-10]|nr:MAG: hypothetical protein B7Z17_05120 [Candidatus Saccharibacteria bacterium 32-49-10]